MEESQYNRLMSRANIITRLFAIIFFLTALSSALYAEDVPVGNKMKPDPELQEKAVEPEDNFQFVEGDTIIISKRQQHYLTGERIARWVYYVRHVIQQVGGKRFPHGILVKGINSWVQPEELLLTAPVERGSEEANRALQERIQRDKEAVEQRRQEVSELDEETKTMIEQQAEQTGLQHLDEVDSDSLAAARAEQHRIDSIRRAREMEEEARLRRLEEERLIEQQRVQDSIRLAEDERARFLKEAEEADKKRVEDSIRQEDRKRAFLLAPQHRFSIGLRGGVASLMQETKDNIMNRWKAGYDVLLDLQYSYFFGAKEGGKTNLGITTGVSIGYSRSPIAAPVDTAYTITDLEGNTIDYTVSAGEVNEKNAQLQLEIPIMFSLRHQSGVFMNVGPKIVLPVFAHYNQKISEPLIDAYFADYGVHVPNEVVTGRLEESKYKSGGKWNASSLNVMLTAELGYEWMLRSGNALGLGAYANYSLYDLYKNNPNGKSIIEVGMPQPGGAQVDVHSATDTYGTGLGYFDCGVKLVYHFCFWKEK